MSESATRRKCLKLLAASAGWAAAGKSAPSQEQKAGKENEKHGASSIPFKGPPDHDRRIQWWREAKFGMFIHWGLYSIPARGEWVMAIEDIPVNEYELLAGHFKPHPDAPREWARVAREAGMRYMVMTTKHHEGFCLFDTKTTDYCAPKQGPGRDLVREYVNAVRAEGLRVGFYFSLMDWHHPDGMRCKVDATARSRFVDYVHTQVRELMTNYGKIDVLWYDMAYPLDAEGWQSKELNEMVFRLQPDIVINNRSGLPGDFLTPEQRINASKGDWESCMTLNDNWGYASSDDNWKPPKTVITNLIRCAQDGGNYLLNIGPMADGSVPDRGVRILKSVGEWMQRNGSTIYGAQKSWVAFANGALFTRQDNMIYTHIHSWPGTTLTIGGIQKKPKVAKLMVSGREVEVEHKGTQLIFSDLPNKPPDDPVTVIAAEFESAPVQNSLATRIVYAVLGGGPES
ncbi:MAG: alpha-L-fucosidase [Terriglobia bacterium]|jgi:alpha-L-fucosidase